VGKLRGLVPGTFSFTRFVLQNAGLVRTGAATAAALRRIQKCRVVAQLGDRYPAVFKLRVGFKGLKAIFILTRLTRLFFKRVHA